MSFYSFYKRFPLLLKKTSGSLAMKFMGPRMRALFSNFINPEDLVYDIGSYKGELSQVFLELGASVVCVEPQPTFVEKLNDRFKDNSRVTIVDKGVADSEGKLRLMICDNSKTNSTFLKQWQRHPRYDQRKWKKEVEVEVITLQSLIEKYGKPAFCKIDVEGFEDKVINGLNTSIPYLSFEFDQEFFFQAEMCVNRLLSLGKCEFNYSKYFNYSLETEQWLSGQRLISRLDSERNGYLRGDIYVRFS